MLGRPEICQEHIYRQPVTHNIKQQRALMEMTELSKSKVIKQKFSQVQTWKTWPFLKGVDFIDSTDTLNQLKASKKKLIR
jgi:hypothetical protein